MTPDEFDRRIAARFADCVRDIDDMKAYQDVAVDFMEDHPFSMLVLDMGLGKTVSTATLIARLVMRHLGREPVLIVGPLRVATETWPTEFRLWRHLAWIDTTLIHVFDDHPELKRMEKLAKDDCRRRGLKLTDKAARESINAAVGICKDQLRRSLAREQTSVHIIAMHNLEWLVDLHGKNWPYRTVIIDESSMLKDHSTARFKALKKVRNAKQGLITRMHLLTATPAAEGYMGLFPQIWLLDKGERLGSNVTAYRERYFKHNSYTHQYKIIPGSDQQILDKISDIALVMRAVDYLDEIHEPVIVQRKVHLSERQREMYEEMERDFTVKLDDGTEVEAETAAAVSQKLLQMASGALYETVLVAPEDPDDPEMGYEKVKRVHKIHDHKIDALKEIVEEAQGATLLVAYHFKSSLDRLKKAFPKAVVMDREGRCIKKWNDGQIPMLLIHPQSGGHGLNLQHGGHNLVFFDLPWSLELYLQLIGRLARQGQLFPVVVQMLIAAGTLDEAVAEALVEKRLVQDTFIDELRTRIRRRHRKRLACAEPEL